MKNLVVLIVLIFSLQPSAHAQKSRRSSSSAKKIPTVSYCELIRHPSRYNHKMVRVKANLFGGMEVSAFEDFQCNEDRSVWVEFDDAYKSCTTQETYKAFRSIFHGSESFGSHKAEIVAVGRFEAAKKFKNTPYAFGNSGFGHLNQYPYQFTVRCLEQMEESP